MTSQIVETIMKSDEFLAIAPGWHGRGHASRVFVLANTLAPMTGRKLDMTAIAIAALLHDCGRQDDGSDPWHAVRSAEKVDRMIQAGTLSCNRDLVMECILRHCPSPDFHETELHGVEPSLEALIVTDADKLDRFRFTNQKRPCKAELLELPQSRILMDLAARLNGHGWRSWAAF